MDRPTLFLVTQSSCVCFVATLFLTLGVWLGYLVAPPETHLLACVYSLGCTAVVLTPVLGAGLAVLSYRGMRRNLMHRADIRLALVALVLNVSLIAALAATYSYWLPWLHQRVSQALAGLGAS